MVSPSGHTRRGFLTRAAAGAGALAAGGLAPHALAATAGEAGRKPNVLVLMTDQERFPQWTPDLPLPAREWLDARSVTFDRFHHSAVPCSPSRACFWTGLYPPHHGIYGNFLQGYQYTMDPSIPTIGDLMKEQGYRTAFIGKWHLSFFLGVSATEGDGLTEAVNGRALGHYGFDHSPQSLSLEPVGYNDGYVNDPIWTRQGVDFLKRHGGDDRPWFLVVSLLNPHDISYFPRGFMADVKRPDWGVELPPNFDDDPATKPRIHQQYKGGATLITGGVEADDVGQWRRLLNLYCDLIVNTDEMIAALIEAVADAGALDDTVIVRTSDHGELGGSHRLYGKGPTMYEEQVRMPLTVAWPGRFPQGRRTETVAEAVDLAPTLLDLAGVDDPKARYPWLRGRSLVPALERPEAADPVRATLCSCDESWSPTEQFGVGTPWKKHMRALVGPGFKIARYFAVTGQGEGRVEHDGQQELEAYDLTEDPYELRNLAADRAYGPLVDELLAWLREVERDRHAPLELPRYGPPGMPLVGDDPIGHPDIPVLRDLPNEPLAVRTGRPGSYVQLPFEDPRVYRALYDGRFGPNAHALRRAAHLCELTPK